MIEEDKLDSLLTDVGMGTYQILGLLANIIIWAVLSPHTIGSTLLNPPVGFTCEDTESLFRTQSYNISESNSIDQHHGLETASPTLNNTCIDPNKRHGTNIAEQILIVKKSYDRPDLGNNRSTTANYVFQFTGTDYCPYVLYDDRIFTLTVRTEFHLICDRESEMSMFQNSYIIGEIIGCIVGGDIGDRLGRSKAVLVGSFLQAVATLAVAFSPMFYVVLLGRFIVGMTDLIILVPIVTYAMEMCPPRFRGPVGMIVGLPYSIGVVVFAGIGYYIRNWRHLYMATAFAAFILLPVSWVLDESPRWLIQANKPELAEKVIKKMARINKSKIDSKRITDIVKHMSNEVMMDSKTGKTKKSLKDRIDLFIKEGREIFQCGPMRNIMIASPMIWILNELHYYGIIFNANNFSGSNPFIYLALIGVADAVAIFLGTPACSYLGRKTTVGGTIFTASLSTFLVMAVPEDIKWLQWVLVLGGFLMCACGSQALFVYTPELFPTTLRTRGFAFSNLAGIAGILLAPFVPEKLSSYGWWVTSTTLGCCGFLASMFVIVLPETNNVPMCETISDVVTRSRDGGFFKKKKKCEGTVECKQNKSIQLSSNKEPTNSASSASSKNRTDGIDNNAFTKSDSDHIESSTSQV